MSYELLDKLKYSYVKQKEEFSFPLPLQECIKIVSNFFANNATNKLCIVFPSKEFVAQWLSIPMVLFLIKNDFTEFKGEISESYRQYKPGEKLILNNLAIVEWVGVNQNGVAFKTKGIKESSGAEITIRFSDVIMLQKASVSRKALSSLKSVKEALPSRTITPTEKLLNIDTYGNSEFIKKKVCLITKYKSFNDSIDNIAMNFTMLPDYFQAGKINENGDVDINTPLLLANNLSNLALYTIQNPVSTIIIDGFTAIQERGTDFSDIDAKNIPTILITDLSEIENFGFIGNYGFEFFNFSMENLNIDNHSDNSPFQVFNKKLKKYINFRIIKEVCQNTELETIVQKIHSIEKDESNNDLNTLKVYLIQLANIVSRICHIPIADEIADLNQKVNNLETFFQKSRIWLGDSQKPIEESILLLKMIVARVAEEPSEKCKRLKYLMSQHNYDYIICATEGEAKALNTSLPKSQMKVITVADVNNNLLSSKPVKAIITGWAKSTNINRILSSFLFSELTVLFYQFEHKYYNSLQRRNRKYNENIKSTINRNGIRSSDDSEKPKGFDDLYFDVEANQTIFEISFDILEFELKLDNSQYSKYIAKENLIDSIKAKRVDFENDLFIYSSESHKFLVINELIEKQREKANLNRKKLSTLKPSDVVVLINTDRDILAELVAKNTSKQDLSDIKQWTDLWKNLLKEYFTSIRNDFKKLIDDLRKHGCKKHEVTIRTWLQDENRIGPDDDADLISIALMADSKLLYDNIGKVREAIRKMTGWRMRASDFISDAIEARIHEFADNSLINKKLPINGLGSVTVLKITEISNVWENIDVRYVNRLIQKDNI